MKNNRDRRKAKPVAENSDISEYTNIFKDIRRLNELIAKYELDNIIDTYQIENMIGHPQNYKLCKIEDLTFKIRSSGQKPIPFVQCLNVSIDLSYEYNTIDGTHDLFNDYQFNLEIQGYDKGNDSLKKYFYWHLDKETDASDRFIHPLYHFHAGGKRMKNIVTDDENFVISSPRLAHPPLDIILSIHFLIQNFIDGKDNIHKGELMADEDYIGIITRAQKRVLDPYFAAISGKISHNDYKNTNLFPLYL